MLEYCEIPAPVALDDAVECCWISASRDAASESHRVLPDGCADIIFRFRNGRPQLLAVGAMTRFGDMAQPPRDQTWGIRFRPGMWAGLLGVQADEMTDRIFNLEELWGPRARRLCERMANAHSAEERAARLAESVCTAKSRTPVQRAIGCMEMRRGLVSLDQMARESGLSARQFRRIVIRETGLSPKLLARILRFRHAESRAAMETGAHAGLAAECGFADQAHMIAEFRRFAGHTPCA